VGVVKKKWNSFENFRVDAIMYSGTNLTICVIILVIVFFCITDHAIFNKIKEHISDIVSIHSRNFLQTFTCIIIKKDLLLILIWIAL